LLTLERLAAHFDFRLDGLLRLILVEQHHVARDCKGCVVVAVEKNQVATEAEPALEADYETGYTEKFADEFMEQSDGVGFC
jgi:hypothetical protein